MHSKVTWACTALLFVLCAGEIVHAEPRNIIVFGGNGFIGADVVSGLIGRGDKVTLVNRGNWYWDSAERIRPYVDQISCNRRQDIDSCEKLVQLVRNTPKFDAVFDFSAYGGKETREASALLRGKLQLYVLISSDSVYEVCDKSHDGPTVETDADGGPVDGQAVWEWGSYDHSPPHVDPEYGIKKYRAEEELIKQRQQGGIPYVFLRIPDVIGPRDTTYRWWVYQIWTKLESHLDDRPLSVPDFLDNYKNSFVYSPDVAKMAVSFLNRGPDVYDQAYNLAFSEAITLKDTMAAIQKALGKEIVEVQNEPDQSKTLFVWPSVRKGPIDVSKTQKMLGFEPTPWEVAIKETTDFFEQALASGEFIEESRTMIRDFSKLLYGGHNDAVYRTVHKLYGIDYSKERRDHQEL